MEVADVGPVASEKKFVYIIRSLSNRESRARHDDARR